MPAQKTKKDSKKNKQTYPLTNTGSIFYSSDDIESASDVEKFIFRMLSDRHEVLANSGNQEIEALSYVSLEEIVLELESSKIPKNLRTVEHINLALEDILRSHDGGKNRMGYLYPVLSIQNQNLVVKLALIAPQVEAITDIDPYRKKCFDASIPALERIIQREIPLPEIFGGKTEPETFIYRKPNQGEVIYYEPSALSFEKKLEKLTLDTFYPISHFPVEDFFLDLSLYCSTVNSILELDSHYHVIKGDFSLDPRGDVLGIPEIFIHFHSNLRVLHKLLMTVILDYVNESQLEDSKAQIESYDQSFSSYFNQDPEREQGRLEQIESVLSRLPGGFPDDLNLVYEKMRYACKILKSILQSIPQLREEATEKLLEESLQKFVQRISLGSKEKKILQIVRTSKAPEVEAILDKELSNRLEIMISNHIHTNFGYYEESADGKKIFHVVDPQYLSGVILNHAILSKSGQTALKQYRYALKIEYILKDGILRHIIDSGFTSKELGKIKEGLKEIADEEKKKKLIEEKLSRFNQNAAIASGILTLLIFFALFKSFKSIILLLLSIPISAGVAFYMGKQFRKKKVETDEDEPPSREKETKKTPPPLESPPTAPTLFSIIEPVIFPNSYKTITERIYTAKKLKKSITENYKALNIKASQFLSGKNQEKAIEIMEKAIQEACIVLQIPKDKIPKNQPAIYYFNKKDMETNKTREAILAYFKKVSEMVNPPDPAIKNYYTIIIDMVTKLA